MVESADERQLQSPGAHAASASGLVMTRRRALYLALGAAVAAAGAAAGCSSGGSDASDESDGAGLTSGGDEPSDGDEVVVYASPSCGCCGQYAEYLGSEGGYPVDLRRTDEVDAIRAEAGVPDEAAGCHTTTIRDYVVEGHVPLEAIDKLLRERPAVDGISLPGMPTGSPGMSGPQEAPFEIVSFAGGTVRPFTTV
ncbi:MAG TPA: DUF411 domain-containing protein [Acidimicrobiales bacterium]